MPCPAAGLTKLSSPAAHDKLSAASEDGPGSAPRRFLCVHPIAPTPRGTKRQTAAKGRAYRMPSRVWCSHVQRPKTHARKLGAKRGRRTKRKSRPLTGWFYVVRYCFPVLFCGSRRHIFGREDSLRRFGNFRSRPAKFGAAKVELGGHDLLFCQGAQLVTRHQNPRQH